MKLTTHLHLAPRLRMLRPGVMNSFSPISTVVVLLFASEHRHKLSAGNRQLSVIRGNGGEEGHG
jgi:hypothetical protein